MGNKIGSQSTGYQTSSASSPSECPQLSSSQVMDQMKKVMGRVCTEQSAADPFCQAVSSSSTVSDFTSNLKKIDQSTWHAYWKTPAGQERLMMLLVVVSILKCASTKHNREIAEQVGGVRNWFLDDLLPTVSDFPPVKENGAFTKTDIFEIQRTVDDTFCSGDMQTAEKVLIGLGSAIGGVLLVFIFQWVFKSKKK